jgi:hypothetical protein
MEHKTCGQPGAIGEEVASRAVPPRDVGLVDFVESSPQEPCDEEGETGSPEEILVQGKG